jgi:hypothetical protein
VIYYREPFDMGGYFDPTQKTPAFSVPPGNSIAFIAVVCIENDSDGDFNFDPNKLLVSLNQSPYDSYSALITSSSGPVQFGEYWSSAALQMAPVLPVPRHTKWAAPLMFTAITQTADNDPNDQVGKSIPGDNNHVRRHDLKYCPGGVMQPIDKGICATAYGPLVSVRPMQDFDPRWAQTAQPQDFSAAQLLSVPPAQSLPQPACP